VIFIITIAESNFRHIREVAIGSWAFLGGDECDLAAALSNLPAPIAGFGITNCAPRAGLRRLPLELRPNRPWRADWRRSS